MDRELIFVVIVKCGSSFYLLVLFLLSSLLVLSFLYFHVLVHCALYAYLVNDNAFFYSVH